MTLWTIVTLPPRMTGRNLVVAFSLRCTDFSSPSCSPARHTPLPSTGRRLPTPPEGDVTSLRTPTPALVVVDLLFLFFLFRPLCGQYGVFSKSPISSKAILCEYGGLVDLESCRRRRALQLEVPNSDEKTLLLSAYPTTLFISALSCPFTQSPAVDLSSTRSFEGEKRRETTRSSRSAFLVTGSSSTGSFMPTLGTPSTTSGLTPSRRL